MGGAKTDWPQTADSLIALQAEEGRAQPGTSFDPGAHTRRLHDPTVAGCFVCFDPRDRAFAGAALLRGRAVVARALARGQATTPYQPGLLALREGAVLEQAVRSLPERPDVLLVNATGRDHPRRFGLASHLGMVLGLPSAGVTDRPLLATGDWPADARGAHAPLWLAGELVASWVRTRAGARPVVAHAGWQTSVAAAVDIVAAAARRARTPEPLRRAREVARNARARAMTTPGD
jgi:deoxyribonuclease V